MTLDLVILRVLKMLVSIACKSRDPTLGFPMCIYIYKYRYTTYVCIDFNSMMSVPLDLARFLGVAFFA